MSDSTGLTTQHMVVTLASGDRLDLETANPDMVRWDLTRAKHKWPDMEAAPMLWATFVTWRAATRLGLTKATWDEWSETECMGVEFPDAPTPVDPTQQSPGSDSV